MPEDLMRYDLLAQSALKGVVREALRIAETSGLPGDHHFYIAFNTRHPGVILSDKIAERYPREMTIVLQHQYWNLKVHDDRFEVELSFDNVPEHLIVPFDAVKGFLDPAVQFGLQFETVSVEQKSEKPKSEAKKPGKAKSAKKTGPAEPGEDGVAQDDAAQDDAANVVSLDHFRRK